MTRALTALGFDTEGNPERGSPIFISGDELTEIKGALTDYMALLDVTGVNYLPNEDRYTENHCNYNATEHLYNRLCDKGG